MQLITKHFTLYSDFDAAKGKGYCIRTVFIQTLLQYLQINILFNNGKWCI